MITAEEARKITNDSSKIKKQLIEIENKIKEYAELGANCTFVKPPLLGNNCKTLKEKGFLIEEIERQREDICSIKISW